MSFSEKLEAKAKQWSHKKNGDDQQDALLIPKRIYILPTKQGIGYVIMCFVMLLASMNYNNNLGLALTFLLVGLGIISMHHCHANLLRLNIAPESLPPVFAGETAHISLNVSNTKARERYGLRIISDKVESHAVDIAKGSNASLAFDFPTLRRGEHSFDAVSIISRFPLTLFQAWSWLFFTHKILVYPKPFPNPPPLPHAQRQDSGPTSRHAPGEEDFMGLRSYHPGDPPRRIAWKALAHSQVVMVKEFSDTVSESLWLDWDLTEGHVENRLSVICAWILECLDRDIEFGMTLPHMSMPMGRGKHHAHACLSVLARF